MLRKLDQVAFLGFKVWEFSFKSLPRRYGHAFIKEIILKHPRQTLKGCLEYRRFLRQDQEGGEITQLFAGEEDDFIREIAEGEGDLLVAMGFCQKPLSAEDKIGECPAGRFNHDCLYLANLDLSKREERLHPICQECTIRAIGTKALWAGAQVYIMTSALDIAHDIFVPALNQGQFQRAIFFLCPYSAQAIILPLFICQIKGYLIAYSSGSCSNYDEFTLADRGIKGERTTLSRGTLTKINHLLEHLGSERQKGGRPSYSRFEREGNIYAPQ